MKRPYTPPALTVLGTFASLTRADQPGPCSDLLQNAPSAGGVCPA